VRRVEREGGDRDVGRAGGDVERRLRDVRDVDAAGGDPLGDLLLVEPSVRVGGSMISVMGVRTCEGFSTVTPIPLCMPSRRMFLLKPSMPCFDARYGLCPGPEATLVDEEPMLMMRPPVPVPSQWRNASRQQRKTPVRLGPIVLFHSSSVTWVTGGASESRHALLISRSRRP
jgi:hypothetical protein